MLIHSDNFQALNLLQARYREQVKCIYIDPPYNTDNDGFIYKDRYKSSSWLSLVNNSLQLAKYIIRNDDAFFTMSIDKNQLYESKLFLDTSLSHLTFINTIVNVNNPKGRSDQKHLPTAHDNIILYATKNAISYGWSPQNKVLKRYRLQDSNGKYREIDLRKTGNNDLATDRPKMAYPFAFNKDTGHLIVLEEGSSCPIGYFLIYPMKTDNIKGRWRWQFSTAVENISRLLAKFQPQKNQWTIFEKDYLDDDERVFPTSVWDEKPFNSERGSELFINLGFSKDFFKNPKPVGLLEHLLEHLGNNGSYILDYFAGSGTTAHAVINLNREDGGKRKYILVEQAEYFNTVLKPRVQKVIYSKEWKDGKPQADGDGNFHGVPQIVKVLKLESYEDTLNNLQLKKLDLLAHTLNEQTAQDYLLHYMLDIESRDSLLSSDDFHKPFDYRLNIASDSAGAYTPQLIDLVETFNYLLGLRVDSVEDRRYDKGYVFVEGHLEGEPVLLVWRDCERWDYDGLQQLLEKKKIKPQDSEFSAIYINGDHTLPTVWQDNDADGGGARTLKIRSIEAEFRRLMFAEAE